MKKTVKILAILALVAFSFATNVQAQKFGHVEFAKLYSLMPGQDSVRVVYEAYAKGLQNQVTTMQAELENKFMEYKANQATMSNIIKQTKEREIQDLQTRIEAFSTQAQQDLTAMEQDLTAPIIESARKAVEDVAKENGYTYIFNYTEGMLLYATPSDDVLPLVKRKLGIN